MILHRLLEGAVRAPRGHRHHVELPARRPVPERPAPRPHPARHRAAEGEAGGARASTTAPTTASRTLEQVDAVPHAARRRGRRRDAPRPSRAWPSADEQPVLHIEHREIRARRKAGGVVWFDFKTLCGGPRSQNDYLELASRFHTVLLSDVPHMPRAAGVGGAALHLAGGRAVRPARQADPVGRGAGRRAVHRRAAGPRSFRARCRGSTRCTRPNSWRWPRATSTPR